MKKITFDDICRYLEDNGLRCVSMVEGNDRVYIDNDDQIEIHIKENIPNENMTPEDEERIKNRLIELGYL